MPQNILPTQPQIQVPILSTNPQTFDFNTFYNYSQQQWSYGQNNMSCKS